jgi:hypothetical protein
MFLFRLFALCSTRASALVIMLSDSPCERIGKRVDLSDFEIGQIVGVRLAGALEHCDENCHITRCIESDSF